MTAERENEINRDRDEIFDKWLASDRKLSFRTWLGARPTLEAKWEATS